jgi:AraC-like DNA-binding protein
LSPQRPATIRLHRSLLAEAAAIIEAEYASNLSLDDVARRVATSRRQLQRAYADIAETTFREHLAAVRMRRAAELLRDPGMPVAEAARRVGYRQPAQFAKAFRRHLGCTPSEFRTGRMHRSASPP